MESATINNKFTYHSPNEEQVKKFQNIRYNAKNFAHLINDLSPESYETDLAIEKLEEAVMWANAAIARHGGDETSGKEETPSIDLMLKAGSPDDPKIYCIPEGTKHIVIHAPSSWFDTIPAEEIQDWVDDLTQHFRDRGITATILTVKENGDPIANAVEAIKNTDPVEFQKETQGTWAVRTEEQVPSNKESPMQRFSHQYIHERWLDLIRNNPIAKHALDVATERGITRYTDKAHWVAISRADDLRMMIDELEDDIACAEHDEEEDGDTSYDLDSAYCRLHDLKEELKELEGE